MGMLRLHSAVCILLLFVYVVQRKETLLVEYKKRGKASTFVDRRIGENDPAMSLDDKMLQRFAAERQVRENWTHVWSVIYFADTWSGKPVVLFLTKALNNAHF